MVVVLFSGVKLWYCIVLHYVVLSFVELCKDRVYKFLCCIGLSQLCCVMFYFTDYHVTATIWPAPLPQLT